jgi:DNA polymerase-3 subunit delta'
VTLLPLHGHAALRERLGDAIRRDALPGSLLLHGPRGIGKQRVALWLAQRLLCTGPEPRPCGSCQSCRYAVTGGHPDIHWYFPRPKLKDSDASPQQVKDDFREAILERAKTGAYPPPAPTDALYVATVRTIVQSAALAPALGARKTFVIGDAERMVPQEGADQAANAFLKLLEEPPANTNLILTTSEPGALLPTIRSRVVALRVPLLGQADVEAVLAEPAMQDAVAAAGGPGKREEQLRAAAGAPGALLGGAAWADALIGARRLLDAATSRDRRERMRVAFGQGSSKARGAFTTSLDALSTLLHDRVRASTDRGNARGALAAARALDLVEDAKERAAGNVNPQLVAAELLKQLDTLLA